MKKTLLESRLRKMSAAEVSPGTKHPKGSFLVEASVSLILLIAIALVLVSSSLNILKPRVWTMQQNLADAYLSQEVALANRADFDDITNGISGWGSGNATTAVAVNLGKMPGFVAGTDNGRTYQGQLTRVRVLPVDVNGVAMTNSTTAAGFGDGGNTAMLTLGDLGIRSYELQSHLTYEVGGRTYVKSRTVIRSQ